MQTIIKIFTFLLILTSCTNEKQDCSSLVNPLKNYKGYGWIMNYGMLTDGHYQINFYPTCSDSTNWVKDSIIELRQSGISILLPFNSLTIREIKKLHKNSFYISNIPCQYVYMEYTVSGKSKDNISNSWNDKMKMENGVSIVLTNYRPNRDVVKIEKIRFLQQ